MAKVSLRRRVIAYAVLAAAFGAIARVLFPVSAYSGPGPSANRVGVIKHATMAALMYAEDNQGYLPDDLSPNSPRLLVVRNLSPVTLRQGEPQDSVPPTFWNPALEGRSLDTVDLPNQTIIYFEGADNKQGERLVTFVNGSMVTVPAPVVTDAILRHDGVLPSVFDRSGRAAVAHH